MLSYLATYHSRKIAFALAYIFFLTGVTSVAYGHGYGYGSGSTRKGGDTLLNNTGGRYSGSPMTDRKPLHALKKNKPAGSTYNRPLKKAAGRKYDIGGPTQPEMSGFRPAGADNMVDPFSGDFSYNVNLFDVGGYPVNIFYNSGITMDQEASWVGLGWNINPGTITRNMRGLPDDFNGKDIITKTQYTKPDKTYGVNVGGRVEVFGGALGIGVNGGIFYNNMRGLGLEAGINPAISLGSKAGDDKTASLSFGWKLNANSQSGGSSTFNIALGANTKKGLNGSLSASIGTHSRQGLQALHLEAETKLMTNAAKSQNGYSAANGNFAINPTIGTSISFAYPSFTPSMRTRTSSENYDLDLGFGGSAWGIFGHLRLGGYYTRRWIKDEDMTVKQPAYGMLYYQLGQKDKNALMDFNRLNDGVYTPGTPAISVPVYTYDVYSITGEGTGGSFRAYRGDVGYVQDALLSSGGSSAHLGIELGAGGYGHGAINANVVMTPSTSGGWDKGNLAKSTIAFKESQKDYQAVYFKNPGEKAIPNLAYQDAIGGEDLVRLKMTNTGLGSPTLVPSLVRYTDMLQKKEDLQISPSATQKARDKRTQIISTLTAEEAARVGLNNKIRFLKLNEADSGQVAFGCSLANRDSMDRFTAEKDAVRKLHHVSEIDVLMQDGRRYIYDIPVYNKTQVEVTFNKKGSAGGKGENNPIATYTPGNENTAKSNNEGKDGFVERQVMPPYAHSYLLTGLLSPNYVDVKGDGITEDDMGDAIKFNYAKSEKDLKWRTPSGAGSANLNEGLKTDKDDDKGHYTYGEREMWYLYSIESKNMVARFYVRNDRKDARSVLGENGGLDPNFGAYRLSKISLFTKGELLKNPSNPRPVKTAYFEYDYSLCQNAAGSEPSFGKLTLKGIYFTYNGNNKVKRNYYRFNYPSLSNPAYSFTDNDRWGNYKDGLDNPGPSGQKLNNADYPYTSQNAASASANAAAWTMNQVILPSGAAINVQYEADDYAFVQDRRACNMFNIVGFGRAAQPSVYSDRLYDDGNTNADNADPNKRNYDYIYAQVTKPLTHTVNNAAAKQQIESWYLGNSGKTKQVYMKLAVKVPPDARGEGIEMIPVYAEVTDWGLVENTSGQRIYLKVKALESKYTPMVHYVMQFLKSNLPSKAYPGYDVSEEGGLKGIVKALGGLFHSFREVFSGGIKMMMNEKRCRQTDLSKCLIRLTDPYLKKHGGGLRVKKLVINDNWDQLSKSATNATDGMPNATYGQEYFYTKKELVNGEQLTISSGVASWEPALGSDENPHRVGLEYYNKTPKADYDYRILELPVAEMLFPSASVGYSRVEVRSIHRDTVKNAAGITVSEFYTSREFPTTSSFTPLSEHNAEDRYESGVLDKLLKTNLKTAVALSQGFKVDLNDMHGKMKKQATYSPNNPYDPISYTENFYSMVKTGGGTFKLNHSFPVIAGADGKVQQSTIGREIEVMTDFREHNQQTITTNINFNIDVIAATVFPIPIPTNWKPVVKESNIYRSSSILKVVNHYSMLDSVVAVDKGSMVSTKNLVYDAETGDPLLTRTNNEQNKPIYSFSYPAHWAYSGMGLAYKNIDVIYSGLTFRHGKLETAGVDFSFFESGDEIMVSSPQNNGPAGTIPCDAVPFLPKNNAKKIWAVYSGKAGSATPQWLFVDAAGNPYTAANVQLRIIRSGKRNMFGSPVAGTTSLKNPVNAATGQLIFNDDTEIIQTTGATYKDHWRVDNGFFLFDSSYIQTVYTRVKAKTYPVEQSRINSINASGGGFKNWLGGADNPGELLSRSRGFSSNTLHTDTWVRFNLAGDLIPANATVYQSALTLLSHTNYNVLPMANTGFNHVDGQNNHSQWWSHQARNAGSGNDNSILVMPIRTQWPATENGWQTLFVDGNRQLHDWSNTGFIPGTADYTATNYTYGGIGTTDSRIGFSNFVITRMMDEARSNSQATTGFRFMRRRNPTTQGVGRNQDLQQCFFLNGTSTWNAQKCPAPYLTVYYTICGDTTYSNGNLSRYYCNPPALPRTAGGNAGALGRASFPDNDGIAGKLFECGFKTGSLVECRSKFTRRKSINPYVEGIWGNWRVDTTFVYYGDRKENTVGSNPVDLRKGGTIINYRTFWNFSATAAQYMTRNNSVEARAVWSWNSTITQYNRKGYEIENKDPLGRFNAGLYGYNQQLPVAVINNSRYMESMYDGFEDYDYQSNSCTETCKPRRHVNMGDMTQWLDESQKHSGKKSLRILAGDTFRLKAPVLPVAGLDKSYAMRVKVDSSSWSGTMVAQNGNGLSGRYAKFNKGNGTTWLTAATNAMNGLANNGNATVRTDVQVNLGVQAGALTPPFSWGSFVTRWEGYLVPRVSGSHQFRISYNDGMRLKIKIGANPETLVADGWSTANSGSRTGSINLTIGVPVSITVEYWDGTATGGATLQWQDPTMTGFDLVPQGYLYTPDRLTDAQNSVTTGNGWCTKLDSVNVRGNALTDTFQLIQNRKMIVSAWVKVGGNDCKCSTYVNNKIRISYTGSSTTAEFTPAGSIIEGWQRYEGVFEVAGTATDITVSLINRASATAWYDDLRIHPFNGNMKSFVYHPQNLRLTAELDENNYTSFYEYDDDGTLSRVKKETVNGVKTITETRSHLQKAVQ